MNRRIWLLALSIFLSLSILLGLTSLWSPRTKAAQIHTTIVDTLEAERHIEGEISLIKASPLAITRTIYVDNIDDNNPEGGCTLREAIDVANAGLGAGLAPNGCTVTESGAGTPTTYEINLPNYTYTLTGSAGEDANTSGDLDIFASMTINGADSTILDGGGLDRVLHILAYTPGLTVNIFGVTIQNGHGPFCGGIYNNGGNMNISGSLVWNNEAIDSGGGICTTDGTLTISDSSILNNEAGEEGGGIYEISGSNVWISDSVIAYNQAGTRGGGLFLRDSTMNINGSIIANNRASRSGGGIGTRLSSFLLNIFNSTILGNAAYEDGGGGISIRPQGRMNIANSTISNNFTNANGGGITIHGGGVNLTNVTISDNVADDDTNGSGDGGGIICEGCTIKNTIIAGNSDRSGGAHDCSGTFTSHGYNLIGENSGCVASFPGGIPNVNNDYVGTTAIPLDPLLGNLTGQPAYFPLQLDSPAIDKILETTCTFITSGPNPLFTAGAPVTTDQAGNLRDSICDIGAYEVPSVGIQVLSGGLDIPDDSGSIEFGTTLAGIPITKTFNVRNIGKTTALTLANLTLPSGFSVVSDFGSTTVVTNSQTTFTIQLDAVEALDYTGQISFTTNVTNRNPFNFTISGLVNEPVPLSDVSIQGAPDGVVGLEYPFLAAVVPVSATIPITYTWQATGHSPIALSGSLTNTVTFTWATTSTKTLTVTATNLVGSVTDTHTITIEPLKFFYLPMILKDQ